MPPRNTAPKPKKPKRLYMPRQKDVELDFINTKEMSASRKDRRTSPSKHWFFTFNNPDPDFLDKFMEAGAIYCDKYVLQKEKGFETGTEHFQGYIEFVNPYRPTSIFYWTTRIHWEKVKDIPACIRYCQKERTRIDGPWFKNITRGREICTLTEDMLYQWQHEIIGILRRTPDPRVIHWYWEPNGNTGKSTFTKYLVVKYNAYMLGGKGGDMKNALAELGSIPELIIIDVPRSCIDYISYQGIEEIKNGLFFSGKYNSKMICGPTPHIIVFANSPPEYDKLSKDRWNVRLIPDFKARTAKRAATITAKERAEAKEQEAIAKEKAAARAAARKKAATAKKAAAKAAAEALATLTPD